MILLEDTLTGHYQKVPLQITAQIPFSKIRPLRHIKLQQSLKFLHKTEQQKNRFIFPLEREWKRDFTVK